MAEPAALELRADRAARHARHHRLRHAVSASLPDASAASPSIRRWRTSCASGCGCERRCRPGSGWRSIAAITRTSTRPEDPHSPIVYGIWRVVFLGTGLYHKAAHNEAVIEQYGKGTPDDFLDRRIYTPLAIGGPVFTLVTNVWLFGTWGLAMWLFEMAWIPFFAAGVINGLGHWWGYRNFQTPDESRNLPGQYLVDPDLRRGAAQQPPPHPELAAVRDAQGRARSRLLVLPRAQLRRPGSRPSSTRQRWRPEAELRSAQPRFLKFLQFRLPYRDGPLEAGNRDPAGGRESRRSATVFRLPVSPLRPGVNTPTEPISLQSVCSGCGSDDMSWLRESLLTNVTRQPGLTVTAFGLTALLAMVIVAQGRSVGSLGDSSLQPAAARATAAAQRQDSACRIRPAARHRQKNFREMLKPIYQ